MCECSAFSEDRVEVDCVFFLFVFSFLFFFFSLLYMNISCKCLPGGVKDLSGCLIWYNWHL